jgi:hypothetical protein
MYLLKKRPRQTLVIAIVNRSPHATFAKGVFNDKGIRRGEKAISSTIALDKCMEALDLL